MADRFNLPRLPAVQSSWGQLQILWQQMCRLIEERLTDNSAAITAYSSRLGALEAGYSVVAKSETYTEDSVLGTRIIKASGTFTINLPPAADNYCRFTVKLVGAGTVTLDPAGSETIDGAATYSINTLNQASSFVSDGTNWILV